MSQDSKYQFHMGCGESLRSQWWSAGVAAEALHKGRPTKHVRAVPARRKTRGGRKE